MRKVSQDKVQKLMVNISRSVQRLTMGGYTDHIGREIGRMNKAIDNLETYLTEKKEIV